jgi:two-component system, OmpR family, response regulator BaeR
MSERVLIVEDEDKIAAVLSDYLSAAGFETVRASSGPDALNECDRSAIDIVLLDLNLPGLDGLEVCRRLRGSVHEDIGIIMVTARIDEVERLLGLEVGADDYVCKPFSPREVVARARSLMRRRRRNIATINASPLRIDEVAQRALWQGELISLTPVEWRLLRTLWRAEGRILSRAQLLDAVHSDFRSVSDRAIDSHIKNLRKKLALAIPLHECVESVYGLGYRFDAPR